MGPLPTYPYMPEGRNLKYVPHDHAFMIEAAKARAERSGDSLFPVGIVLVRDSVMVASAGNGFNRGPGESHVCPRILAGCKSGEGYDLCHLHDTDGHAEPMLMAVAQAAGIETEGADVYMYGHWWCCEPCWKAMIDAGIRDVYVSEDAHDRFSRNRVYAETLVGYPEEIRAKYV